MRPVGCGNGRLRAVWGMSISVAVFGASGLVGRACLHALLAQPGVGRVIAPGRRPLPASASWDAEPERLEAHVVDFASLQEHPGLFAVDRVICALGTTMRQAGSREAFRRVDHDLPLEIARLALAAGVPHFLLVSAIGADPASRVFYNRVKGAVEQAVLALPFRSTTIVRPSLLLGERDRKRTLEAVGAMLGRVVPGRWRPVHADDVARVLVDAALEDRPGGRVLESDEIRARARVGG